MDKVDILIIGAGVVGLAIAERLASAKQDVLVVEKQDSFGRETSSRNSEVIHAGLYHPENSLKTRLCVEGNRQLYKLCAAQHIPCQKTGKLVVATSAAEEEAITAVYQQGLANGVEGLRMLSSQEARKMEPLCVSHSALYSPESGIIDTHQLMHYLEHSTEVKGGMIIYGHEVVGLDKQADGYIVQMHDPDHQEIAIKSTLIINAAGLGADNIAALAGIDIKKKGYTLHPCKGEYFSVSHRHSHKVKHLIYPAPSDISLGTHVVLSMDEHIKLGPNAFYVDKLDYSVDETHRGDFFARVHKYLPFLEITDLTPDMSGIRPKLQAPGEKFHDFIVVHEPEFPGLINLIGIESPGLTACLALAGLVEALI